MARILAVDDEPAILEMIETVRRRYRWCEGRNIFPDLMPLALLKKDLHILY